MKSIIQILRRYWNRLVNVATVLLVLAAIYLLITNVDNDSGFSIETDKGINPTPAQITSIRKIGKWEFLSMQIEEIVDTTHQRFLLPDETLVRIYHGTIRLGIDMETLSDEWFQPEGDSLLLTLPEVAPLNRRFIDEAQTQTFFETGTWSGEALEALYKKAERQMKRRLHDSDALRQAEDNGRIQVTALMRSLGFKRVRVEFKRI